MEFSTYFHTYSYVWETFKLFRYGLYTPSSIYTTEYHDLFYIQYIALTALYPTLQVIAQTTHLSCLCSPSRSPSVPPTWVASTMSAACASVLSDSWFLSSTSEQLLTRAHLHRTLKRDSSRDSRGGRGADCPGLLEPQMHFRRLQLLILPFHSPLLLSILSAIKYSMHRAARRTKQVKISITKNAHVLPCPAKGKGECKGEAERERERLSRSRCYSVVAEKTVGARPRCVLLPAAYTLRLRRCVFCLFLGSEPRYTCPENYPLNAACQLERSFLRSLRLISVNHTAQCWGM